MSLHLSIKVCCEQQTHRVKNITFIFWSWMVSNIYQILKHFFLYFSKWTHDLFFAISGIRVISILTTIVVCFLHHKKKMARQFLCAWRNHFSVKQKKEKFYVTFSYTHRSLMTMTSYYSVRSLSLTQLWTNIWTGRYQTVIKITSLCLYWHNVTVATISNE